MVTYRNPLPPLQQGNINNGQNRLKYKTSEKKSEGEK